MKNKIGKILSIGVFLGIGMIPILNLKNNINYETKINDEFNVCDYRIIPPEIFQTPDGLHFYTTEFNKFIMASDINNNNILEEGEKDDNLGEVTYYQILVERNFDGWWLFDIDNLVWIDTFNDKEMVYLNSYLEFYLQDFFIWSYNERLNLDEINGTRELNIDDIQTDYEIWIDDAIEIGVGWNTLWDEPNDGGEMGNAVYISFDPDGFQNSETGDVDYEPIDNSSTYYAGVMDERMAYPSEKQSIDIYDKYTQDDIDRWFVEYFIPYFEEDMDKDDNVLYSDSVYYDLAEQFYLILNQEFIKKYGVENLWNDRNVNDGTFTMDGWWTNVHMYETPDIRYKRTPDLENNKLIGNEFMFNIYDESGELINNKLDFHDYWSITNENENGTHEWWTWDESFETLYIKITPIDQVFYLDEEQSIEYHSSDLIDGYYNEDGTLNEYYITINVWEDLGYEPNIPSPNELGGDKGNGSWWITLIVLLVVGFVLVGLFGIWKFKERKI